MRLFTTLCMVSVLSGCSLLQDGFGQRENASDDALSTPRSFDVADAVTPIVTHRYALDYPGQTVVGEVQVIIAREQDTFSDIARTYGLGYDELVHANPDVDPWLPGKGTLLTLPTRFVLPDTPHEGIVLNIAAKRLYWYPVPKDGEVQEVVTYPIGIGRVGWATPTGEASVIAKAKDPAWYVPASVRKEHRDAGDPLPAIVPPGPDNPLGRHVLKLDMPGYLLHGTNQPYGVGMRVSHGCVRLYPEDIEALYKVAGLGTSVRIVNEPLLVGWRDKQFYAVAYPRLLDDDRDAQTVITDMLETTRERHWMLRDDSGASWLSVRADAADGVAYAYQSDDIDPAAVLVLNVASPPEDAPSREEVSALIEEMMAESEETGTP